MVAMPARWFERFSLAMISSASHHRDGKTEAILCRRSGRRRPELRDILRRHMHRLTAQEQPGNTVDRAAMMSMLRLELAQQHVGIDENAHSPRGGSYSASRLSSMT
jgi:hypothetical protein